MSDNTLTGLIVTIYSALDTVAREQIGMIPAVRKFAFPGKKVAQNEPITYPIVPAFSAPSAISASNIIGDSTGITVGKDTMYMDQVNGISWGWNGEEATGLGNSGIFATTQEDAFRQAFRAHANQIEAALTALFPYASRAAGTQGTVPFSTADDLSGLSQPRLILENNGMWMPNKMKMVLSNSAMERMRAKQGIVFKANEAGTQERQLTGVVARLEGWDLHQSGQIGIHTSGAGTGFTTNGASANAVVAVNVSQNACSGTGTIGAGDIFTVAGESPAYQYVANTINAGKTIITLNKPGVFSAGGLSGSAALTTVASFKPSMCFNEDAIVLVSALPNLPEGGDQAVARTVVQDPVSGLLFEVSEYKGYRKTIYLVAAAWGVKCVKSEGLALLIE
jgi:hypothetical protein